ncbi:MAG: hypothetical protein DMF42_09910 [Verrucomicrobia bacterium]|nr:MAG: hypothetical protein DMF42_09910 [Verrucomicrobiota bacterium]
MAAGLFENDDRSRLGRIAESSSRNAVNFSSACTTKRFPSRCASTIQVVRPWESIADTPRPTGFVEKADHRAVHFGIKSRSGQRRALGTQLRARFASRNANERYATAHCQKNEGGVMRVSNSIAELRQQIHDDLRVQHPEWVKPNGECPKCDFYESRLMEELDTLTRTGSDESVADIHRVLEQGLN